MSAGNYHFLNRGSRRAQVFHKDGDYQAFLDIIAEAGLRVPMRVLAFCLMPNHFHLALWPLGDGDLSRWMHWLLTTHVGRYQRHYHTSGHVWQGRFKAFPIEEDDHLLTVLRYIERNPLRAGLVARAEDWPWSSLHGGAHGPWLDAGPESARRGAEWVVGVNAAMFDGELVRLRLSAERGTPFGSEGWTRESAERLGLESSLGARGRPHKNALRGAAPE